MMKYQYCKILLCLLLIVTAYKCVAQQSEMIKSAKLIYHEPVASNFILNLNKKLSWVKKESFRDSYTITSLEHKIAYVKKVSSSSGVSFSETRISDLVNIVIDSVNKINRIIILKDIHVGHSISANYVIIESEQGFIGVSDVSRKETVTKHSVDSVIINTFLKYLKKRKEIPEENYLKQFDGDDYFLVYEIDMEGNIYANWFYDTDEYFDVKFPLTSLFNEK